ncbi:MAG: phytanoyl-CoA dioxygenase family protein, partial [Verrucomicrobiota bacterium]
MKKWTFAKDGFEIHRNVIPLSAREELREEAKSIARQAGSTCVRHLRARSPLIDQLSTSKNLSELLPSPHSFRPVRSILFDKTANQNWPVPWHQDLTICVIDKVELEGDGQWTVKEGVHHVQPPLSLLENMVTLRLHLDDTPATNGALFVLPQSHRRGILPSESFRNISSSAKVACACRAGDVLLMSPLLAHSSPRSDSPEHRRVLHIEYAPREDLHALLDWAEAAGAPLAPNTGKECG